MNKTFILFHKIGDELKEGSMEFAITHLTELSAPTLQGLSKNVEEPNMSQYKSHGSHPRGHHNLVK